MIYMVDHVFADPALEPAWHEWYAGYLRKLVCVPGILSAQRFKAIDCIPSRFLAMYTVASEGVFTSEGYKAIGGGGSQSARFHSVYRLWTRNLFDDPRPGATRPAARAPAVRDAERVVVWDSEQLPAASAASLEGQAIWLEAVGLHRTTRYRGFLVLDEAHRDLQGSVGNARVYVPFTPFLAGAA